MKRLPVVIVVVVLAALPARSDIPAFFHELFLAHEPAYAELQAAGFAALCRRHGLDPGDPANRAAYLEICFLHDLFTGAGAGDGDRGGILRIPYFWHWIEPNPRHEIRIHPDGTPLVDLPPPADFARYRSAADIDRVPSLYLADLVTSEPRYQHPRCGTFHTFGWCSEREMAFVALVTALGYRAKVKQAGIHTWSEVWCTLRSADGGARVLVAEVDNTFDTLRWAATPGSLEVDAWAGDIGAGETIAWYDRQARAPSQLAALAAEAVSEAAAARIETLVREHLAAGR